MALDRRAPGEEVRRKSALLHNYTYLGTVANMATLRIPISTASRKGVSGVVGLAEGHTVVLTNHGRAVAKVDSPGQVEESARLLREASLAVIDAAGDLVEQRAHRFSLDEVCARLGLDVGRIRDLADERVRSRQ